MYLIDQLAEARIEEAIDKGALEGLPGRGRPLAMDDDSLVPDNLRAAYRILKNSGYLPQEITLYTEIRDIESLLGRMEEGGEKAAAVKRLSLLRARLGNERCGALTLQSDYYMPVAEKLGRE